MTLITQAITLCFTLLSATLLAREIIYDLTVTLLFGYVALILGIYCPSGLNTPIYLCHF